MRVMGNRAANARRDTCPALHSFSLAGAEEPPGSSAPISLDPPEFSVSIPRGQ
jgi:hypothetical protein